jgi:hypothetical protein
MLPLSLSGLMTFALMPMPGMPNLSTYSSSKMTADVEGVALEEGQRFGAAGALAFVQQHRLVRSEVVVARNRIRNGVLEQHFALQAQVRGAWHLDHVQLRLALELDHVARRVRQGPGHQQVVELVLLAGQGGDLGNVLRVHDRGRILLHVALVDRQADNQGDEQGAATAHINVLEGDLKLGEGWHDGTRSRTAKRRAGVGRGKGGRVARQCPFAIVLMLTGNGDMETIPPKKRKEQAVFCKKFCDATPMMKSSINC